MLYTSITSTAQCVDVAMIHKEVLVSIDKHIPMDTTTTDHFTQACFAHGHGVIIMVPTDEPHAVTVYTAMTLCTCMSLPPNRTVNMLC